MVQDTEGVIADADVVLWVVDALAGLRDDDRYLCDRLRAAGRPTCIAVNKIDRRARAALLPQLAEIGALLPEAEIVPVSALEGENVPKLIEILASLLPEGPRLYDEDTITDQTERKLVEEIIREQIFLQMREEVPYAVGVVIEKFEERDDLAVISAAIHVERKTQKGIVIGAGGARIKEIGRAARLEAEDMLGRRVYLELFVRVNEDWTTDPRRLTEMGL
jgi:GTP-binding protein Era